MDRRLPDCIAVFELASLAFPKIENPNAFRLTHIDQTQLADFLLAHSREHRDQGEPEFFVPNDMHSRLRSPMFRLAPRPDWRFREQRTIPPTADTSSATGTALLLIGVCGGCMSIRCVPAVSSVLQEPLAGSDKRPRV